MIGKIKEERNLYRQLSEEEKQFLKEKRIHASHTAKEWIRLFKHIAAYDEQADALRSSYKNAATISGFLIFFSIFPLALSGGHIIVWIVFLLLILFLAFAILNFRRLNGLDIANVLRTFLMPVLRTMREEMPARQDLALDLVVNDPLKREPDEKGKVDTKKVQVFIQPWINAKLKFADGSVFHWTLADHIRRLSYWKRSSSGKSKHKVKIKVSHFLGMKFGFSKGSFTKATKIPAEVTFEESEGFFVAKAKHRAKATYYNKVAGTSFKGIPVDNFFELLKLLQSTVVPLPKINKNRDQEETLTSADSSKKGSPSSQVGIDGQAAALSIAGAGLWHYYYFDDMDYQGVENEFLYDEDLDPRHQKTDFFDS